MTKGKRIQCEISKPLNRKLSIAQHSNQAFRKCHWISARLPNELLIANSFIKHFKYCYFYTKTKLLRALSVGTTIYLSWRCNRCSATFGSASAHWPIKSFNHNLYQRPNRLNPFGTSFHVFFFTYIYFPFSGIILDRIHMQFKVILPLCTIFLLDFGTVLTVWYFFSPIMTSF